MKLPKKKLLQCSRCTRRVWRTFRQKTVICLKCTNARKLRWQHQNSEKKNASAKRWYERNRDHHNALVRAWQKAHPEKVRKIWREYRKRQKQLNDEVIASLPCLECGVRHTFENRAKVLRRMLPARAAEIREAYPHFYGGGENSAGERTLYRDLRELGAVRMRGTFYMQREARAAA